MAEHSQVENEGKSQLSKTILRIALVAYLLILLVTSLWPTPIDGNSAVWQIIIQVMYFCQSIDWLKWVEYNQLEAIANVLLYIPLGVFLYVFLPKAPFWVLLLTPAFISHLAESLQGLLLPARYSTIDDVIHNGIGGALGVLIAAGIHRLMKSK
ncbi:MAG: VanZ family protein [Micrococcales bacterium]|nr:VanZ family protein [Micrococcales bacterium]